MDAVNCTSLCADHIREIGIGLDYAFLNNASSYVFVAIHPILISIDSNILKDSMHFFVRYFPERE